MLNTILVVDDDASSRDSLRRLLEVWGYKVVAAESAEQALVRIRDHQPAAILTDLVMPGMSGLELVEKIRHDYPVPIIILSGQGSIEHAVDAIKLGATDFLEKPVEPGKLKILLKKMEETSELLAENRRLRKELRDKGSFGRLRGVSEPIKAVFLQIEKVAPSTLSVLIAGESGTGKELVAQTLHDLSPRRREEFVALNCAAIPATLLESEIFGHERGAFTGAVQRKIGCFEMADNGTLFLDEIAEMDESLQAKLLRVLQEQTFRRLGGQELIQADVRVVAATNRDPKQAIKDGKLREDLYYRLNVFNITLPPLRDREADIRMLAVHFAEEHSRKAGSEVASFHPAVMGAFLRYNWPGNVRELKNAIDRAILMSGGETVSLQHLPDEVVGDLPLDKPALELVASVEKNSQQAGDEDAVVLKIGSSMADAELELIRSTLEHTRGNKTRSAKILGISLKTMHNKVKKYNL
jgi:DNA-binding NtrC family response regulator